MNSVRALNFVTLRKFITVAALFLALGIAPRTSAQEVSKDTWGKTEDGRIIINVYKACQKLFPCSFSIGPVRVRIEGILAAGTSGLLGFSTGFVTSNLPISSIRTFSYYDLIWKTDSKFESVEFTGSGTNSNNYLQWANLKKPLKKQINVGPNVVVLDIVLDAGMLNLPEDLKPASLTLLNLLRFNLERAEEFQSNIKKSDQKHVDRIKQALRQTINLLADENSIVKLPVTHAAVTEQMRLVMVLATVLNELLEDYGNVEFMKVQVQALSSLSRQIREAYGWRDGLAGSSSKGMSVLSELIDLELRLLASEDALSDSAEIYNQLRTANRAIGTAVLSTNGGDARAIEYVRTFADRWNSKEWQARLSVLLTIKDAAKAEVIYKCLRLLLTGEEAMSELTNVRFTIPTDVESKFKK